MDDGAPTEPLDEALTADLVEFGDALSKNAAPDDLLDRIYAGLDHLPAKSAPRAAARIQIVCRLYQNVRISPRLFPYLSHPRDDLDRLAEKPRLGFLFSFHGSGYVRERALEAIDGPATSPFMLSAIAWRLNDWVEPVRAAARRCAQRVFVQTPAEVTAEAALFLLDRWYNWKRWGPGDAALVDQLMQTPAVAERLALRFETAAQGPLASELVHALRGPAYDAYLPRLARCAVTPAVRAVAYRTLILEQACWLTGFSDEWVDKTFNHKRRVPHYAYRIVSAETDRHALIMEALADRSSMVRRLAAEMIERDRRNIPDLDALIVRLQADPSPSIRERGDFLARKRATGD